MNTCRNCEAPMKGADKRKKYCCDRCRKASWAARHPRVTIELPEAIKGSDGQKFKIKIELQVSALRADE